MRRLILAVLPAFLVLPVLGCASVTGVSDWKEQTFKSALDRDRTYKAASQALALVGKVQAADPASGSVNGECDQSVDGAVTVYERDGATFVLIKSKLNVKPNAIVIETGDREKCITRIANELRRAGVLSAQ